MTRLEGIATEDTLRFNFSPCQFEGMTRLEGIATVVYGLLETCRHPFEGVTRLEGIATSPRLHSSSAAE